MLKGNERREEIINLISKSSSPLSGSAIAKHFNVSRQVIVQDMAVLRAQNYDIISTNRGYIIQTPSSFNRIIKVSHTDEEIEDELTTIIDYGGKIIDVFVNHKAYGELRAPLNISSRRNVMQFMEQLKTGKSTPLKNVTSGYHYHTISADSEEVLDLIEENLSKKGYLIRK